MLQKAYETTFIRFLVNRIIRYMFKEHIFSSTPERFEKCRDTSAIILTTFFFHRRISSYICMYTSIYRYLYTGREELCETHTRKIRESAMPTFFFSFLVLFLFLRSKHMLTEEHLGVQATYFFPILINNYRVFL